MRGTVHNERAGRPRVIVRAAAALSSVALLVAAACPAGAQVAARLPQVNPDSVRLVADLFFRAVADERWDVAAALVDTVEVRRMVAEQLRHPPQASRREMTVDDFMRDDPGKPRVVAEYELKRYQSMTEQFDVGRLLSYRFADVPSIEALRQLSTEQATIAVLRAQDMRTHFREQMRRSGCGDSTTRFPYSIRRLIATALASDSVAYVLYEDSMFSGLAAGSTVLDPTVMVLRLRRGAWRIVPAPGMKGASFGFSTMACDSTRPRSPR